MPNRRLNAPQVAPSPGDVKLPRIGDDVHHPAARIVTNHAPFSRPVSCKEEISAKKNNGCVRSDRLAISAGQ